MDLTQKFNSLHGTIVSRKTLEKLLEKAEKEKHTTISKRIIKILKAFDDDKFLIELANLVEPYGLNAPRHKGVAKEGLDNCGRLKKGYKYSYNGKVKKVAPVKKTLAKKKISTKVTEKKNPKAVENKPKSVSVTTAIKDVLTLPKFKKEKQRVASLFYKKFEKLENPKEEDMVKVTSDYDNSVFDKNPQSELFFHLMYNGELSTTQFGIDFINAVNGRFESLRNQKHNYALFDGLKRPVVATKKKELENKSISELEKIGFVSASKVPDTPKDVFQLNGEIGKFLQKIQPHKALILIKGTKHTSKSQLAMQIANGFAEIGKPVAYIDYEQGGMESKDTIDSINRNTTKKGRELIAVKGFLENPMKELQEFCKYCEVIVADSVTDLGITADQLNELRVGYPKVIWVFISQVKENGEMYGGNKMAHNPTAIVKCHPSEDPKERYATLEKNRGNDLSLKYSMFYKKLINEQNNQPITQHKSKLSFQVN